MALRAADSGQQNLIAHETTRIRTLGKKYDQRIQDLKGRINKLEGMPEDKKQEMSRKIIDEYRKRSIGNWAAATGMRKP